MGVHYHKRPIVKDGLVYEIDAGNKVSYSGAGVTAYELVNRNNATLINGITFSDDAWIQDGVDDYVDMGQPAVLDIDAFTFTSWFKPTENNTGIFTRGSSRANETTRDLDIYGNGTSLIATGISTVPASLISPSSITTPFPTLNEWHEVTVTWDGTTDANKFIAYLNGDTFGSSTAVTATIAKRFNFHLGGKGSFVGKSSLGVQRGYNRPLTATEILHNYETQKSRYAQ